MIILRQTDCISSPQWREEGARYTTSAGDIGRICLQYVSRTSGDDDFCWLLLGYLRSIEWAIISDNFTTVGGEDDATITATCSYDLTDKQGNHQRIRRFEYHVHVVWSKCLCLGFLLNRIIEL